ncbi:hypothetical protein SAMN06298216_4282 [Spirosomataceae bacterium TFI 002]|nr:hypothetical protein SAMN06298216_4282 [Spirosomataceae bacterium TFI 002]
MNRQLSLLLTFCVLLIFSCEGPEGSMGPAGPQGVVGSKGDNGAKGDTGSKGEIGNANVVYSTWENPAWEANGNYSTRTNYIWEKQFGNVITQEILDQGMVYVYFKSKVLSWDVDTQEYNIEEAISRDGIAGYKQIEGTDKSDPDNFVATYAGAYTYLSPGGMDFYGYTYKSVYNYETQKDEVLPIFVNANFADVKKYTDDLHQIRVIAIKGSTAARMQNIDWDDYNAVITALDIPE